MKENFFMIDNFFQLKKNKTSITQELLAGVTTFVTMAYIVFVADRMSPFHTSNNVQKYVINI